MHTCACAYRPVLCVYVQVCISIQLICLYECTFMNTFMNLCGNVYVTCVYICMHICMHVDVCECICVPVDIEGRGWSPVSSAIVLHFIDWAKTP